MFSNLIESSVEKSTRKCFVSLGQEYLVTPSTDSSSNSTPTTTTTKPLNCNGNTQKLKGPKLVTTTSPEKANIKTSNDVVVPIKSNAFLKEMTAPTSKSKDSLKKDQSPLDLIEKSKGISSKSSSKVSSTVTLKRSLSTMSTLDKANITWLSKPFKLRKKNNYNKIEEVSHIHIFIYSILYIYELKMCI